MSDKAKRLRDLEKRCHNCRKCSIGGKRPDGLLRNVFSNMCIRASIMVVGQNPGEMEVRKSRPFVGSSGEFFDKAIKEVTGLDRSQLYVCNTIRCFSDGNRPPKQNEIENCQQFLEEEIGIVQPKLMIALGSPALKQLTGVSGIERVQGKIQFSLRYKIPVLPLYHPSPLNMNQPERREKFYKGLEAVKQYL